MAFFSDVVMELRGRKPMIFWIDNNGPGQEEDLPERRTPPVGQKAFRVSDGVRQSGIVKGIALTSS